MVDHSIPQLTRKKMEKLIKVMNLLGSPHDGEILGAAKAAMRILAEHELDWNQVIRYTVRVVEHKHKTETIDGTKVHTRSTSGFVGFDEVSSINFEEVIGMWESFGYHPPGPSTSRQEGLRTPPNDKPHDWKYWVDKIVMLLGGSHKDILTNFEKDFMNDIIRYEKISDRQWGVIKRIYTKVQSSP